jgi:hypothetical protein
MRKLLFPVLALLCASALSFATTTYSNIDDKTNADNGTTGWGSCTTCAGGANNAGVYWTAPFQTTPSRDGASREFYISGPQYSNALWWYKVGPNDAASNFAFDFWVQVDSNAASLAQTLEFDTFQFTGGRRYMFGTQCNYADGHWDVWSGAGHWVMTGIACPKLVAGNWYHITWQFHRNKSTNQVVYDYLSVTQYGSSNNLVAQHTYIVGLSEPSTTTSADNLGVQFQLDLNGKGGAYSMWVDQVSLTAW